MYFFYYYIMCSYIGIDRCGFILMANGTFKQVLNLQVGDIVASLNEYNNIISNTVKHIAKNPQTKTISVCNINNVIIPINQPIKFGDYSWIYPSQVFIPYYAKLDYLYEIYLESGNNVIINDIPIYIFPKSNNENEMKSTPISIAPTTCNDTYILSEFEKDSYNSYDSELL